MVDWRVRDKIQCILNKTEEVKKSFISPTSTMLQLA